MTQPPPSSLHSLYRLHGDRGQTEEEDMRLENRSRRQKKKGRRPSTEWTLAEGEREGGEGGLVYCSIATGLNQGEILDTFMSFMTKLIFLYLIPLI